MWIALDTSGAQVGQAAVSFLATLVFVNVLTPKEFGVLAGVWMVWMLIMSMSRSVFGEQVVAQGSAHAASAGYREFIYFGSFLGTVVTLAVAIAIGIPQVLGGSLYIVAFVASDGIRYGAMGAERSFRLSIRSSMGLMELYRIALAALALLVALLGGPTTLASTFMVFAGGLWLFRSLLDHPVFSPRRAIGYVRSKGRFERLMSLQFLFGTGVAQSLPFIALGAFGAAQFGVIRLAQSLLSPMTLVTSAFQPELIRLCAAATDRHRLLKIFSMTLVLSTIVAASLAAVAITAIRHLGTLVVPPGQLVEVNAVMVPITFMLAMVVIGQPGGAIIRALRLGGVSLGGQLSGVSIGLILCVVAAQGTLADFAWAMAGGSACTVLLTYLLLGIELSRTRNSGTANRNGV